MEANTALNLLTLSMGTKFQQAVQHFPMVEMGELGELLESIVIGHDDGAACTFFIEGESGGVVVELEDDEGAVSDIDAASSLFVSRYIVECTLCRIDQRA